MSFQSELKAFEACHSFRTVEIGDCSFSYLLCGREDSEQTLVYLVGGTGNPLGWYQHVLAMENRYRILLLNYPMGVDQLEPLIGRIGKLLKHLGISRAVWIGASFGGYIAQLMARACPEQTEALVLYATTALTEKGIGDLKAQYRYVGVLLWLIQHVPYNFLKAAALKPAMQKMIPKGDPERTQYLKEFTQWVYEGYTRETDLHMTRLMADIVNLKPVTSEDYAFLRGKILLILPEGDQAFTEEMQQDLISLLCGAEVKTMPGGHLATLCSAGAFAEATDAFLRKL